MAEKKAAPAAGEKTAKKAYKSEKSRLEQHYVKSVIPAMMKEHGYKNVNQVPKIEKIVVQMGLGQEKDDSKKFNNAVEELALITGQKPAYTTAKKSISNFKLREGMKVGAKTTLRGNHMYQFLDKLISVALPRVRDFRGLGNKSFDSRGNYAFGIKEQLVFPEISYEKIDKVRGMDIMIITTAKTDKEAASLLVKIGMPIKV